MSVPGIDLAALQTWGRTHAAGVLEGPLSVHRLTGGLSNITAEVRGPDSAVVVRRPPLGDVPRGAHDVLREARVLTALAATTVPVPRVLTTCADASVLGAPFFLMSKVDGTSYRSAGDLDDGPVGLARTLALDLVDTMAALHSCDPDALGLADLGRPGNFFARQVDRWATRLVAEVEQTPDSARLVSLLADVAPSSEDRNALLHGDLRLDNALVVDGAVVAVLDWEMATVGDPLTDLGLLLAYDRLPQLLDAPRIPTTGLATGYPTPTELISRYAGATGRIDPDLRPHCALAFLKLAAVAAGIGGRADRGQAVDDGSAALGAAVAPLVAAGLDVLVAAP